MSEHAAEAARLAESAMASILDKDGDADEIQVLVIIQLGQLHATIAVAEQLGRIVAMADGRRQ